MDKEKLRTDFDKAVDAYLDALVEMYGWDSYYGGWVAADRTGVYAYAEDVFINLSDIIYIVDNDVPKEEFDKWYSYCLWANDFNMTIPTLPAWVKGAPRASKAEMERLEKLRQEFNDACNDIKERF